MLFSSAVTADPGEGNGGNKTYPAGPNGVKREASSDPLGKGTASRALQGRGTWQCSAQVPHCSGGRDESACPPSHRPGILDRRPIRVPYAGATVMRRPLAILVSLAFFAAPASAQDGLKVYISADMEGLTGVVTGEQLGPGGFEYEAFREVMTGEVLAAIEGARAAGATEILISDSHGNGQNLILYRLPDDVMVVRSWPRPLMMMEGVDEGFDAAIFIGYHSGTTNPDGVRAHTMSSANLAGVKLNGMPVHEAGLNAAIAGHFGVPVVMVSGDDATIEETRAIVGDVEGAVVKRAISFHAATTLTPAAGRALIREKVEAALRRLDDFEPFVLDTPVVLELTYKNYRPAQVAAMMPGIERADAHSIRYTGESIIEVAHLLEFLTSYEPGLEP